jgi:diguanylate cyclase (GGDEF)-like protein/PAS domain S-box-containing protein
MNFQERESTINYHQSSGLKLAREIIEQVFDAISEAIFLVDTDGNLLLGNEEGCRFLGLGRDELITHTLGEYLVPSQSVEKSPFSALLELAEQGQAEFQVVHKPGQTVALRFIRDVAIDRHVVIVRSPAMASPPAAVSRVPETRHGGPKTPLLPMTEAHLQLQNMALQACDDAIVMTDSHGRIEWVNPAFTRLTGYTPDEAIGRNPRDLVNSGRQSKAFFRQLWHTILARQVWRGEIVNRRKDGTLYHEKMTITPVSNEAQEISHFIAIKQDITERKQADLIQRELHEQLTAYAHTLEDVNQALQLSEQRYRSVVETQTELICRFRPDGTLTFANEAYSQFLGIATSDLTGQNFLQFIPAIDRPRVEQQVAELQQLTPEAPLLEHEHAVHDGQGQKRWQHWINRGLFNEAGQLIEVQASGRDITALKLAELAVRDRERRLDLFFTQLMDGCFFMTLDAPLRWDDTVDKAEAIDQAITHLRITRVNQAMLDQYGATEDDFLGLTLADFFAHDLETSKAILRQLFDDGRIHINTDERKLDGTPMWIEGDYICLYDECGYITGNFGLQREVTDLKQTIAALEASERNYRFLVENQSELVLKLDADGQVIFASPSYCKLFDKSLAEILQTDFRPVAHPDDQAIAQQTFAQLWQPPHTCRIEQRTLTRDGWCWLSWSNQAVVDSVGNIRAVVAVGRDITERKAMEEALRHSEQRFRTVLETLTLIAITLDYQGNLLFCNDYLLNLTGWQRDEVLHQSWAERFLPPNSQAELHDIFRQTFAGQAFPTYYENEIVTRSGDRRLIAWNHTVQRNAAGAVISLTSIGADITERKHYETQIAALSQRLSLATRSLNLGVWEWDLAAQHIHWDERMLAIYGVAPENFDNCFDSWRVYLLAEDWPAFDAALQAAIAGPDDFTAEFRIGRPDGQVRYVEAHALVLRNPAGQAQRLIGVNLDITERRQQELMLQETTQRLSLAARVTQMGIWELDIATDRLWCDPQMSAIYGLEPITRSCPNSDWVACVHPDDRQVVDEELQAIAQDGETSHSEYRILRPDGQIRHIADYAVIVRDEQGRGQKLIGVNFDITDRRQQELALQETTQRLSLASEAAQLGIWEWDIASDRVTWDEYMYELYGTSEADFSGLHADWLATVHPDDLGMMQRQGLAVQHPGSTFQSEFRIIRFDGAVRHIESFGYIVRNAAEEAVRVVGVNRDISDRKTQETRLKETAQRLTLATDAMQMGVWDWQASDNRLTWDARMHEIYGIAPAQFTDTTADWFRYIHPDDVAAVQAVIAAVPPTDDMFQAEFRIVRPDGDVRHIADYAIFIYDETGQLQRATGVNLDITERKLADQELAKTHYQLQALQDNSPAIIELFDENGYYRQVNRSAAAFLDRPITDVVGRHFDEIHSPDVVALWMERLQAIAASGQPLSVEDRLTFRGEERVLRSVIFPVLAPPGQPRLFGLVATDVTALVQAQDTLQLTAERERLIRDISTNIRRTLDLETILDNTVHGIRQFLKADRVLVYRFNPDWSGDMIVESVGTEWLAVLGETLRDPCFAGSFVEPYRQGRIGQINDVAIANIQPCHRDLLDRYQVRANLVLPVVVQDQLWGLLCIHQCRSPRHWQTDEVTFVQKLIEQVEVAIQQAHLLHETRLTAQREHLRNTITQEIRRSLDLEAILKTTVDEVRTCLNADRVMVYRFHPDGRGEVMVEAIVAGWPPIIGSTLREDCFVGPPLEHYAQGTIHALPDVAAADIQDGCRDWLTQFQIHASLSLPLIVEQTLWGALCVHQCAGSRYWQADEIEFVRQICDQVEIAIQQAQLLEETALQAQREQLFNVIMTAARESLDLSDMMNRTAAKLMEAFEVSRCLIFLGSPQGERLDCAAVATRAGVKSLQHRSVAIRGNALVEYVLSASEPIAKTNVLCDETVANLRDGALVQRFAQRFDIISVLAIAIRYRGQIKGAMMVHHPQPRQWTAADCSLFQQVADQLAIAIEQAELYQQAQAEITQRQRLEAQLRHDAFHDALTGLPNRALFLERLEFARRRFQQWHPHTDSGHRDRAMDVASAEPHSQFAILFLDLDRFKIINDSLGHSFGDQLLQLIAGRLRNCLREVDLAARLGGDEFVILLEELSDPLFATEIAQRIHNILEVPIFVDDREVTIRASIGIAFGAAHYTDSMQILRDADIAMYQAKQSSEEYVVFDESMHAIAVQQLNLESDLRQAIKRGEFRLFFQPIVALNVGRIMGFEALVRWQHPNRGLIYPDAFVDLAEETGLIAAIDLWVLQAACQQLQQWRSQAPRFADLTISVNLSGKQFSQPDLIDQIDHALSAAELDGHYLKLEITESILIENNALAIQTLDALQKRHIQVCMDDFGTGYSSLSYLHRFPVDILKIDKSFILNLGSPQASERDYEIVKAIIALALNLNLQVVAEGIENHTALNYLQQHHCQWGQGYHFAPAVDSEQATRLLLAQPFINL